MKKAVLIGVLALLLPALVTAQTTRVRLAQLAQEGATSGQVIKWNGSSWAPGTDNTTGGGTPAPVDGEYVTFSTNATLTAERVLTSTSTITTDTGTAGEFRLNVKGVPTILQANLPGTCSKGEIWHSTDQFGSSVGRVVVCVGNATKHLLFADDIPGGLEDSAPSGGVVNDADPTGLSYALGISLAPTASTVFTGFVAQADGIQRSIINASTNRVIVLATENTGSSAANRMSLGRHIILFPGDVIRLIYDSALVRWRMLKYETQFDHTVWNNYKAQIPGSGTAPTSLGLPHTSQGGTISHVTIANTNYHTRQYRARGATGATAGTGSGTRTAIALATRNLGFVAKFRWGYSLLSANSTSFVGVIAQTTAPGNANASAIVNMVGFGHDPTQTTLRAFTNDSTGTATATDLGASYPVNTTAWYEGIVYNAPAASTTVSVAYRLDDLTVTPTVSDITTNQPAVTALLSPHVFISNRTDASDNQIEWNKLELFMP
jgi:hypothetical protein